MGNDLPQIHYNVNRVQADSALNNQDVGLSLRGRLTLKSASLDSKKKPVPIIDKMGKLETSGYAINTEKAISHRQSTDFINKNKDLLYVINQDKDLAKEASKMSFNSRDDLKGFIAKKAHELLNLNAKNEISENDLKKQDILASMIVLNTGGIKDFINEDKEIANYFASDGEALKNNLYKKLADKAKELFPTAHPLNDASFFADNPRVGIYLLGHKDVVRHFLKEPDGDTQALAFKNEVNMQPYKTLFANETNDVAVQATQSGSFNRSYFEDNEDLATVIAASTYLKELPKASDILKEMNSSALNNKVTHDSFNFDQFMKKLLTSQVALKPGQNDSLPKQVLESNFGFARLLDSKSEFRSNLKRKADQEHLEVLVKRNFNKVQMDESLKQSIQSGYKSSYSDIKIGYSIFPNG